LTRKRRILLIATAMIFVFLVFLIPNLIFF